MDFGLILWLIKGRMMKLYLFFIGRMLLYFGILLLLIYFFVYFGCG